MRWVWYAFPTGVGMNRHTVLEILLVMSVPHGRGDEPFINQPKGNFKWRSPRAWG